VHHKAPSSLALAVVLAGSSDIDAPVGSGKVVPSSHATRSMVPPALRSSISSVPLARPNPPNEYT
jgi:hypothetical protein